MYSPQIIEERLWRARKAGLVFRALSREDSIERANALEQLRYDARGALLPNNQLARPLEESELEFIRSERVLSKLNFAYYLERYHAVELDPGIGGTSGIGPAKLLESQRKFISAAGKREEICAEEVRKYKHTAGILIYAHKCRQVAFTSTACGAKLHRMLFWPSTRALSATLRDDATGTGELYRRDMIALEHLPFWLKPQVYPNVKNEEIGFPALSTHMRYQAENTKGAAGIGTGAQTDFSHFTEVPLWSMPGQIRFSFLPGMPKAASTFHVQEGTSAGKGGYWQEVSEGCRQKRTGFEDWTYIFVGWYVNVKKWRSNAPADWVPEAHTVKHAELVERTSPEFCDGMTQRLSRDQMYWWEKTRALHAQNGELASFLANYPATPEQSFTNWSQGALPIELIEKFELDARKAVPYEPEVFA